MERGSDGEEDQAAEEALWGQGRIVTFVWQAGSFARGSLQVEASDRELRLLRWCDVQHVDEGVPVQSVLRRCCVDFAPPPAGTAVPLQVREEHVTRPPSLGRMFLQNDRGTHAESSLENQQAG
jgi:hypothetical protein